MCVGGSSWCVHALCAAGSGSSSSRKLAVCKDCVHTLVQRAAAAAKTVYMLLCSTQQQQRLPVSVQCVKRSGSTMWHHVTAA